MLMFLNGDARRRTLTATAVLVMAALGAGPTHASPDTEAAASSQQRPRIGLVLSGGGARGLAHVGVLKVLEEARVPVDVVVGTSMGAIIGGLYATGMTADTLQAELLKVNWGTLFQPRVQRRELSQRLKEDDFEISPVLEFGMRDGELRLPLSALSGRGLETLLRRLTLPAADVTDFDRLAIPFRAVCTDMESGMPAVLAAGDLALALRSSMSVPGVFAPTEWNGRILGDGGLVNNVPIDVARAMGVDRVIVVNVGTPLAARDTLGTAAGMTAQMINILTEQNVRRNLALMRPHDVLITPALGTLDSGSFARAAELVALGEQGASAMLPQLAALSLSPQAYAQWRAEHPHGAVPQAKLAFVKFDGSQITQPQRLAGSLESTVGQPFDAASAERDARRLAATGDYQRADYKLVRTPEGDGLVFELEDKSWGPNYFGVGLDLSTDFAGNSAFNIKIRHTRRWLDPQGTEWRNAVQIGAVPRWSTELYRPMRLQLGGTTDWFAAGYAEVERRLITSYDTDSGVALARFNRGQVRFGVDLGQPWGEWGEVRLGVTQVLLKADPDFVSGNFTGPSDSFRLRETGLRLGAVIDQLDFPSFPQHGYRLTSEAVVGQRSGVVRESFTRFELQGTAVGSLGAHTLSAHLRYNYSGESSTPALGRYTLGGFHELSGYRPGQIGGNYLLFGRLTYYQRLDNPPVLSRGLFLGGTLEAGNAWNQRGDVRLASLRTGMTVFVGSATALGPVYFALAYAPRGDVGVYLFLGRP